MGKKTAKTGLRTRARHEELKVLAVEVVCPDMAKGRLLEAISKAECI